MELVTREYALSENAPPHYRYKTYSMAQYQESVRAAVTEMVSNIDSYLED